MKKKDLYYERIPTKLLREDVKYLGNILGKVIITQEGQKFFDLVEKIRKLSKANKKNPNQKRLNSRVINVIMKLDPKNTFKLTRAFSHFMNLIKHSLSIMSVFRKTFLIRSALFIVIYILLIKSNASIITSVPLILLLIAVYSVSNLALRENMEEFKNSLSEIKDIEQIK